jgi:hypothetical protein
LSPEPRHGTALGTSVFGNRLFRIDADDHKRTPSREVDDRLDPEAEVGDFSISRICLSALDIGIAMKSRRHDCQSFDRLDGAKIAGAPV